MRSIRRFLLVSLLGAVVLITGLAAFRSYEDASHEVDELFDAELAQMARVLQSLLTVQLKRTQLDSLRDSLSYKPYPGEERPSDPFAEYGEATALGHKYERKLAFAVWNNEGRELLGSGSPDGGFPFVAEVGYGDTDLAGAPWRTFSLYDPELEIWIKVGQRFDVRSELTDEIVLHALLPLLLIIPLLLVVIWWVVGRGLSPLLRVSRQVTSRDQHNLAPLDTEQVPEEVEGVVSAINALLKRLDDALSRERQFTANAAHELRTPLAGIRIHAQNLQRQLGSQGDRGEESGAGATPERRLPRAPDHILEGVDQMTHVVEQLLRLSRLEHEQSLSFQKLDLVPLVQRVVASLAPLALKKQQTFGLDVDEGAVLAIRADETSLEMMCRNLVDNAVRYTPAGGEVRIRLQPLNGAVELGVEDSGPGIPSAERERVFERFYRLGSQGSRGSGIGLAIVRQVASSHQVRVELGESSLAETGLSVRVQFPLNPLKG
ncbi:ATP-binding protein [Aestuariirhabdus litorea]|uniref:histidine kinase n=1 Tax=Aestuariirhabdus litorea TaxID=2528527 RepID=A0A3P3VQ11_9GAMM|nr:ATP-binding protein [Aestuariirhabdus litorea]RRJ84028.1 HAMP domain-containing protein [Aestuariirhabdus litorea]RWW97248.1 HAMP domain-containing protein [Endozoicomonadaceae bacterium GTF-13]